MVNFALNSVTRNIGVSRFSCLVLLPSIVMEKMPQNGCLEFLLLLVFKWSNDDTYTRL